jgi:hypothetical protein
MSCPFDDRRFRRLPATVAGAVLPDFGGNLFLPFARLTLANVKDISLEQKTCKNVSIGRSGLHHQKMTKGIKKVG